MYQWKWDDGLGNPVRNIGANQAGLPLYGVRKTHRGLYWCEVIHGGVTHATPPANLQVEDHLRMTVPPADARVGAGDSHTFTVEAKGGYPPVTYAWSRGAQAISGADESSCTVYDLALSDSGTYRVEVSDANTDVLTASARLDVEPVSVPTAGLAGMGVLFGLLALAGAGRMRKR